MSNKQVTLKNPDFQALWSHEGVYQLDSEFLDYINQHDSQLYQGLLAYRAKQAMSAKMTSALLLALAPLLEQFVTQTFAIEHEVSVLQAKTLAHKPVVAFKQFYVLKKARRLLSQADQYSDFEYYNKWLLSNFNDLHQDMELSVAKLGQAWLADPEAHDDDIERLIGWCVSALTTQAGRLLTATWSSLKLPAKLDYSQLVAVAPVSAESHVLQAKGVLVQRDGFELTDSRMKQREVMSEIEYCVYCHKNDGDFCSKGFPVKKSDPKQGLKVNPLENVLTGCPLEEKVSEMNLLKRQGMSLAALAVAMIDNPICALTGHRICNDCMKACIYQKQEPVNIPEVETGTLMDVLDLPWGLEIYDLFTRWNPLRQDQYLPKPYTGRNILVMGMGPAGITLAHHLLMEGFAVVGMDGLKIEALDSAFLQQPIRHFADIKESLADRLIAGFGGVAEYGITVRWDKNFLKLIYIVLMRRKYFQVVGGVRFGGTLTVDNAWQLGFDHLAVAVGAGLPKELAIENSMVPGMRQANDFLMSLQLTAAAKFNSLAPLQIRLPAVVIGGGLTGVDAATELQAYYLLQIEKVLYRYERLIQHFGEPFVRERFSEVELLILDEWLAHAGALRVERQMAAQQKRAPDLIGLIRAWGGVHIVYRKRMQDSPAYRLNHEELQHALAEGICYMPCMQPQAVIVDQYGYAKALRVRATHVDDSGAYSLLVEEHEIAAATILVATGAKPNVAYEFEHEGTFERKRFEYNTFSDDNGSLQPAPKVEHIKQEGIGVFTSYQQDLKRVSFIGDTHPAFHGSVVKAMASAKYAYPRIVEQLSSSVGMGDINNYDIFNKEIESQLTPIVDSIKRLNSTTLELKIKAPLACHNGQPGQFYRLTSFESQALECENTSLYGQALALLGIKHADQPDVLSFIVREDDVASRLIKYMQVGDKISLMGPSGVRAKILKHSCVLFIGGLKALIQLLAQGPALRAKGCKIVYMACADTPDDIIYYNELKDICEAIYYVNPGNVELPLLRSQDRNWVMDIDAALLEYSKLGDAPIALHAFDQVKVAGPSCLLKQLNHMRAGSVFSPKTQFIASVMGPMQCMLKGVCAQCLQWQRDPVTGERTKAVYACSWNNQPMDIIDIDHMQERKQLNQLQDTLNCLWLDYILPKKQLPQV